LSALLILINSYIIQKLFSKFQSIFNSSVDFLEMGWSSVQSCASTCSLWT